MTNGEKSSSKPLLTTVLIFLISLTTVISCKQEPPKVKLPSDEAITTSIESTFSTLEEIPEEDIEVSTNDGVVTLSGSVSSLLAKRKATKVAQGVHGVLSVVNNLVVDVSRPDEELENAVDHKLATNPVTEFWEITTSVNNGVITLKGIVDSWQERRLVEKLAMQVTGVKEIDNTVIVNPDRTRTDKEIKTEIEQALKMDSRIRDDKISVEVDSARVKLSGKVGSARERTLAMQTAEVIGVESVAVDQLEVHPEYQSAFFTRDDIDVLTNNQIISAIERALRYDPRVPEDSVSVTMKGDVAVLEGKVQNLDAKLAAASDARHTAGVNSVENNIEVIRKVVVTPEIPTTDKAIKDRIITAIDNHPYISEDDITVEVEEGIAFLSGTVDSKFEKDRISDVTAEIKGVIQITNTLKVKE